jgi:hypothetical protein
MPDGFRGGNALPAGASADKTCLSRNHVGSSSLLGHARSKGGELTSRQEGATAEKAVPFSKPRLSIVYLPSRKGGAPHERACRVTMPDFWIFQDKPNKCIRIHRAGCATRKGGQGPLPEGRSWHGPYPNYDEALREATEMTQSAGAQINCRFCHPQHSLLSRMFGSGPSSSSRSRRFASQSRAGGGS